MVIASVPEKPASERMISPGGLVVAASWRQVQVSCKPLEQATEQAIVGEIVFCSIYVWSLVIINFQYCLL